MRGKVGTIPIYKKHILFSSFLTKVALGIYDQDLYDAMVAVFQNAANTESGVLEYLDSLIYNPETNQLVLGGVFLVEEDGGLRPCNLGQAQSAVFQDKKVLHGTVSFSDLISSGQEMENFLTPLTKEVIMGTVPKGVLSPEELQQRMSNPVTEVNQTLVLDPCYV
jgi:hypothetical protein